MQGEAGWGLLGVAGKVKSDPTPTLPCKQGRGQSYNTPAPKSALVAAWQETNRSRAGQ